MPLDPQSGKEAALLCVDLAQSSKEYKDVMQEFNKTMTARTIVKIQRIQNPMLYSQYIAKKKDMDKHNPLGHQNEQRLFHGTPANICPQINQQGFNRTIGRQAGGKGGDRSQLCSYGGNITSYHVSHVTHLPSPWRHRGAI